MSRPAVNYAGTVTAAQSYRDTNPFYKLVRASGGSAPMAWFYARTLHHIDRPVFRMTNGRRTFTSMLTGLPMVMLTTTGAKSGIRRTLPLVGLLDGDRVVVIASNVGQHGNPAWFYNLRKNPECTVVVSGGAPRQMYAYEAEGDERDRLWRRGLEIYPGWAGYEKRATDRRIPVMVLAPAPR